MALKIEYTDRTPSINAGEVYHLDDFLNGVHIRAFGHQDGGYISISNATPEGKKNGENYCQVGFYAKSKDNKPTNFIENFQGRTDRFEIKVEALPIPKKTENI